MIMPEGDSNVTNRESFHEALGDILELKEAQPRPMRSASRNVIAECNKLRDAFMTYSDCADGLFEHIDDEDGLSLHACQKFKANDAASYAALNTMLDCSVQTLADIALKYAAFESWMQFCDEHPGLPEDILEGLLRDIAKVAGITPTRIVPSWKFPTILFPAFWLRRSKPRPANVMQT